MQKIINKVNSIKKGNFKRTFKNLKVFDYKHFINQILDEDFVVQILDNISNGTVLILKNSIDAKYLDKHIDILNNSQNSREPISPKIVDGIKNGYYISENLSNEGYKTVDKSFYFFAWNNDETGLFDKIYHIYKPLKILNGLKEDELSKNIPSDGIIERLHIINYPVGRGLISKHYDPANVSIINFGIYGTEYGVDYDEGGFFVENDNGQKINIDKEIKKTDLVLFFPGMIHGVDPITLKYKLDKKNCHGRWFFNLNIVQSHHNKDRQRTVSVK